MHWKTILFVAGICTGIIVGLHSGLASEIAVIGCVITLVQGIIFIVGRKHDTYGVVLSLFTLLFTLGLTIGILRVQLMEEKIPYACTSSCTFDASVASSPETKDAYQVLVVRPIQSNGETISHGYNVQLRVPLYPSFKIGETIRVSGTTKIPSVIPPHGATKSFDYASYLHTKSVGSEMLFPKVEVLDEEPHTLTSMLGRWKEEMVARLSNYISSPASSLASGMLFGNSSMSKELTTTFRVAGLSHIIVLSGFNIAIVIAAILFVFAFLPLVVRVSLASVVVVLFVMMVGGEASVIRATAMAFVSLLATVLGRAYVARQALMLSLLAIILYEPSALLFDVSLHLSFLATAGIVYGSDVIKILLEKYIPTVSLVELLTTTIVAYLATLPYVMYTFGTVSMYALVANVVALPLVPVSMLLSFSVVVLSYISETLSLAGGYVTTLVLDAVLFVARVITGFPFASLSLTISFLQMCVVYAFVVTLIIFLSRRKENETPLTTQNGYLTDTISY